MSEGMASIFCSTLKMEAIISTETLVIIHNPEDQNRPSHHHLKIEDVVFLLSLSKQVLRWRLKISHVPFLTSSPQCFIYKNILAFDAT
jgi:hypothetical protein